MRTLTKMSGLVGVVLVLARTAQAAIYTETYDSGFANGGVIPDGNPTGWWDTRDFSSFSGSGWQITDVNVTFTITGGYNGDLSAYLSHNGVLVPLLNRVGTGSGSEPQYSFGFPTSGFDRLRLDDAASTSIHGVAVPDPYETPTYIAYRPDGGKLENFNTYNPNGTWTIFFADLSGGDTTSSTLGSWSLEITAVPEPVNVALMVFAGVFGVVTVARNRRVRGFLRRALAY
jgi:subtilisin-like proprotein convertase family protein